MKRLIQILLLAAMLVPVVARARTETMAQRKQRIERKYLVERAEFVQGDVVVPSDQAEGEEEILDSEKFKEPQVNLQRQEAGTATMPPPRRPRRPPPRQANRNWLLAEEEDPALTDASSSPFAWDTSAESKPKKKAALSSDRLRRDSYYSNTSTRRDSWFTPRTDSTISSSFDTRGSSFGTTQSKSTSPYSSTVGSGLFGQQRQEESSSLQGTLSPLHANSFGDTTAQDAFKTQTPFQTGVSRADKASRTRQGYTPYKSPYSAQPTQQQPWGGTTTPKEQEYRKQDSFQKWKKTSSKELDPMRDDAFIDANMPKPLR